MNMGLAVGNELGHETQSKGIVSWPNAEWPRERLLAQGVDNLTEAEMLPREPRGLRA